MFPLTSVFYVVNPLSKSSFYEKVKGMYASVE